MDRDELRHFALDEMRLHDPVKQAEEDSDQAFPGRCALCSYTRHPCSTFDLAEAVLELLDEGQPSSWEGKPLGGPLNLPPMEGDPPCICPRLEGADLNCPVHGDG